MGKGADIIMTSTTILDRNFTIKYNELLNKYGEDLAKLNGLSPEQLNLTGFIDNFTDTNVVADASVDPSANVGRKDIVSLIHEMPKSQLKLLCYHKLYIEMTKEFGKSDADEWLEYEWAGRLYMHDAHSSTLVPYCFAFDLKRTAEEGLFWLKRHNARPAKHLETFVDFLKEFINFTSNRQSGAVGLPNLIPYLFYFWNKDVQSGHYPRNTTPEEFAKSEIQRLIYAVNQPYVRDGLQSAFTNSSIFDHEYMESLFGGATFPDGSFMIDYIDEIVEFQKLYMEEFSAIRSENMFTFPVNSISLLKDANNMPVDTEFAKWAIEHNMKWSDSNIFCDSSVTSLSNCCRLKNNIEELGYFNSIGGTALKVGSVKVSTINLERIALENRTEESYLEALKHTVIIDCKILDRVRHTIYRNVEKGLLDNFQDGLIDFEHLYNTIGFMGIYETMQIFGYVSCDEFGNVYYTDDAKRFGKKIFDTIHAVKDDWGKDKDYKINIEQSPGESAAVKLRKKDLLFFTDVPADMPMLGNQFIPLGVKTTFTERIDEASLFDSYCNGGSILHVNIDAPFNNFETAWELFKYIIAKGVTYFAFNPKISTCESNHAFYGDICSTCGKPVKTLWSRIVGFFVPCETYSKERKDEFKLRQWEPINKVKVKNNDN